MAYEYHHTGEWVPEPAPHGEFIDAGRPLTDAETSALRTELQQARYAGMTTAQKADAVNGTYLIDNPEPQGTILATLNPLTLISLLGAESAAKFDAWRYAEDVLADIRAQRRTELAGWIILAQARSIITSDEAAALTAALAATVLDPAWPAQVVAPSPASLLFTDPPLTITEADITQAEA